MKIVFRDGHFYIWDRGKDIAGPMSLEEAEEFIKPVDKPKKKGKKKDEGKNKGGN